MSIRVYPYPDETTVWTEPEPGDDHLGRCLGVGNTPHAALIDARDELLKDLGEVNALLEAHSPARVSAKEVA